MAKIRIRSAGKWIAWLMRGIGATLKWDIADRGQVFDPAREPVIWAFWHSTMFVFPWMHSRYFPHRRGCILSSPSQDGQIIADVCAEFGFVAARGSSSKPKQGLSALVALAEKIRAGHDIGITPDGPRGPAHALQPGIIKLAQLTGAPIVSARVSYSRSIQMKTWDRFELPLPFATVRMVLDPLFYVPRKLSEEEFETLRARLEAIMNQGVD